MLCIRRDLAARAARAAEASFVRRRARGRRLLMELGTFAAITQYQQVEGGVIPMLASDDDDAPGSAPPSLRGSEATKQSRLSPVSLVWIASSLRSLAMTGEGCRRTLLSYERFANFRGTTDYYKLQHAHARGAKYNEAAARRGPRRRAADKSRRMRSTRPQVAAPPLRFGPFGRRKFCAMTGLGPSWGV
jgi:hypothetical protein